MDAQLDKLNGPQRVLKHPAALTTSDLLEKGTHHG